MHQGVARINLRLFNRDIKKYYDGYFTNPEEALESINAIDNPWNEGVPWTINNTDIKYHTCDGGWIVLKFEIFKDPWPTIKHRQGEIHDQG